MAHSSLCFSFFALLWNKHISLIASLLMQYFFFNSFHYNKILCIDQRECLLIVSAKPNPFFWNTSKCFLSLHRLGRMPLKCFINTTIFLISIDRQSSVLETSIELILFFFAQHSRLNHFFFFFSHPSSFLLNHRFTVTTLHSKPFKFHSQLRTFLFPDIFFWFLLSHEKKNSKAFVIYFTELSVPRKHFFPV